MYYRREQFWEDIMGYAIYWSKNDSKNSLISQISDAAATESFHEIVIKEPELKENNIEWTWLKSVLDNNSDRNIDLDSDDLNHCIA